MDIQSQLVLDEILADESFDKAVGQFRLAVGIVTKPLRLYGQSIYVDLANEELVSLAIQLHHKLSGLDEPFYINKDVQHD